MKEIIKVKILISLEMKEEPKRDFLEKLSEIAKEYIDYIKSYNSENIYKKNTALNMGCIFYNIEKTKKSYKKLTIRYDIPKDNIKYNNLD